MSSFFKKALGLFVEFEENSDTADNATSSAPSSHASALPQASSPIGLSGAEIEKFEAHFNNLFEQANLPGPDYYEFSKMMDTLEGHIPDETARIHAVYSSLAIQGLTKQKIVETAGHYHAVIQKDKAEFDGAAAEKAADELEGRKRAIGALEQRIKDHSEMIRKLTDEITQSQMQIGSLSNEMVAAEQKLRANKNGYSIACQALMNKISADIKKIEVVLK